MSTIKSCPKCGRDMLHHSESAGMPEHHVCTNCGHTARVKQSVTQESSDAGKRTLVD